MDELGRMTPPPETVIPLDEARPADERPPAKEEVALALVVRKWSNSGAFVQEGIVPLVVSTVEDAPMVRPAIVSAAEA